MTDTTESIEKQRAAIEAETKLVGLYGDALARARREMEAQQALRAALPRGEIVVAPNLTSGLSNDIEALDRAKRMDALRKDSEDAAYAMDLEQKGLGLTGEAAIAYSFAVDRLNDAKRAGIELSPDEVDAIKAAGEAYAQQRYAIDQQAQAIADSREITRGFFSDWINGIREGGNLFKSFADSVINSLNRIIDKLLDKTLTSFIDGIDFGGMFGKSGGASSLTGKMPNGKQGSPFDPTRWANGGAFGTAQRFANGGAFTNSVVSAPTLFRFANGAALGEMGEAGPEAIMPLKRGPDGALGVQMHGGGRPVIRMGDYNPTFEFAGAVGLDGVASLVRQGGEATYNQMKRDFASILSEIEQNGAVAS